MPIEITVDPNSGVPVFRQIIEQVRLHVAGGMLVAGEELPSTRQLSQELGVNPMTVSKAFSLLEAEGLVDRRPGLPLIVRDLGVDAAAAERRELLARALDPAVTTARQLGISTTQAVSLFRDMLNDAASGEAEG